MHNIDLILTITGGLTVSMALGAFLAGMVVGRPEFSLRTAAEALPMRDAFAVLFFVSVGMLLDPVHLFDSPGLIAATLAVVIVGKPLAAMAIVLLRHPPRVALAVAVALAQIGEFSFILAALGEQLGVMSEAGTNTIVAAAILSITLNPILDPLDGRLSRQPLGRWLNTRVRSQVPSHPIIGVERQALHEVPRRAVIVGYGPVG